MKTTIFQGREKKFTPVLLLICSLQGVISGGGIYSIFSSYSQSCFISYVILIIFYIFVAIFIWIEKEHLADFNIDRWMLWIMVLTGTFFHSRLGISNEIFLQAWLWVPSASIFSFLIFQRGKVPQTSYRWVLIAILASLILLVFMIIIEWIQPALFSIYRQPLQKNIFLYSSNRFFYQLSFVAPMEEFFFRGLSWGYLVRQGWSEKKVVWSQSIIFWVAHISQILYQPLIFFTILPVSILLNNLLVYRSRRLFPSILAHALVNTEYSILYKLYWS